MTKWSEPVTYVSQQIDHSTSSTKYPETFDPSLLVAAQKIYSSYRKTHSENFRPPVGVVIHQETCRGQLVFRENPVLLPHERFVPFEQIEFTESN
jgi:hypothetical protein